MTFLISFHKWEGLFVADEKLPDLLICIGFVSFCFMSRSWPRTLYFLNLAMRDQDVALEKIQDAK